MANEQPVQKRRRWPYVIAGMLAIALALYGAIWYHLSAKLAAQASAAIASENAAGRRASCENLETGGFPLGLGLFCDSIQFEDTGSGVWVTAGRLQSALRIYDPLLVRTEIASPAHLEYPGLVPVDLDWKTFAIGIRLGSPLPADISVSAASLRVIANARAGMPEHALATLQSGSAALRPHGRDLDFTATLSGLGARIANHDASLDMHADIMVEDGVTRFTGAHADLRGTAIQVRTLSLSTSDGGTIALSGPVNIDDGGFLNGQVTVTIEKAPALARNLAEMVPAAAEQIGTLVGLLAPPQNGGKGAVAVQIIKGKVYAGFFLVGQIPPLQPRDRSGSS